jgi:hypothetical protein
MRFRGYVGKQELLILLDSGRAGTFISEEVARKFQHQLQSCEQLTFSTADGTPMTSANMIPQFQRFIQGYSFSYDTRVLPLKCFDMIIGADWLEDYSPTWIHWKKKKMKFPMKGKLVTVQGIKDDTSTCQPINARKLRGLLRRSVVYHCIELQKVSNGNAEDGILTISEISTPTNEVPSEVTQVVQQYKHLFQDPKELPLSRTEDHQIPLIPGAQPVNIRPYRYTPQQKTEIEKHIAEMLQKGIIQHNSSPFASPVLLVKKKDGTWRFCVDYRHLNVITVKNKHPLPILDELMDELAGAKWFTKLDFRSGYHQIRVAKADEMKTTFKTHSGLYEFRVMPFGLTNAPTSFQSILNKIFAPLLRKCVLVFMDDIHVYSPTLFEHVQHLQHVFEILNH